MAKIELTKELSMLIKTLRIENDIKSSELAAKLNKSVAYITKLENYDFKNIDFNVLINILKFVGRFEEKSKEEFNDFINRTLEKCRVELDEEEIKRQKWISKFDKETRQIPIPSSLTDFIKNKIEELGMTPKEIINIINRNDELNDDALKKFDLNKYEENSLIIEHISTEDGISTLEFVRFNLKLTLIDDIISKKIKTINYITILVIIKTLFKLDNFDKNTASKKATQILQENKFYTLKEKKLLLKKKRNHLEIENLLSDYDKENIRYVNEVIQHFQMLSDWQIDYTNQKLDNLSKSLDMDAPFALAIIGQEFYKLDKLKIEDKKRFLDKLNDLINNFSKIDNKGNENFIEY